MQRLRPLSQDTSIGPVITWCWNQFWLDLVSDENLISSRSSSISISNDVHLYFCLIERVFFQFFVQAYRLFQTSFSEQFFLKLSLTLARILVAKSYIARMGRTLSALQFWSGAVWAVRSGHQYSHQHTVLMTKKWKLLFVSVSVVQKIFEAKANYAKL